MEEAPENGKESSHSAHANGIEIEFHYSNGGRGKGRRKLCGMSQKIHHLYLLTQYLKHGHWVAMVQASYKQDS
jgi:hypothetical protein